jgi:hypothetical protein
MKSVSASGITTYPPQKYAHNERLGMHLLLFVRTPNPPPQIIDGTTSKPSACSSHSRMAFDCSVNLSFKK